VDAIALPTPLFATSEIVQQAGSLPIPPIPMLSVYQQASSLFYIRIHSI
jgi:hypothetical protein